MNVAEELEEFRKMAPGIAGGLVGLVVDNPCQFAMVASGSYVVTRGLGRLVRPHTIGGALMTAAASYGVCWWLMGEARARGLLVFRVRDPITGELVTLEELEKRSAAAVAAFDAECVPAPSRCSCGLDGCPCRDGCEPDPAPLIDLDAVEREVKRRAADPG